MNNIRNALALTCQESEPEISREILAFSSTLQNFCKEAFNSSMIAGSTASHLLSSFAGFKTFALCSKLFGNQYLWATKTITCTTQILTSGITFHLLPNFFATGSIQQENLFAGSASSTLMVAFSKGAAKLGGGSFFQAMAQNVAVLCSQEASSYFGLCEAQMGGAVSRIIYAQLGSSQLSMGACATRLTCRQMTLIEAQMDFNLSLQKRAIRPQANSANNSEGYLNSLQAKLQAALSPRSANEVPIELALSQANEQKSLIPKGGNLVLSINKESGELSPPQLDAAGNEATPPTTEKFLDGQAPTFPRTRERARSNQHLRTAGLGYDLIGSAGNAFTAASAAAWGRNDPRALARLAALLLPEEVKLVSSNGREEHYVNAQNQPLSIQEIAFLHGKNLLMNLSSCRELPLGNNIFGEKTPINEHSLTFGYMMVEPFRGAERIVRAMKFDPANIEVSPFAGQREIFKSISTYAGYGLHSILGAMTYLGRPLRQFTQFERYGLYSGSAFAGFAEKICEFFLQRREGKTPSPKNLAAALGNHLISVYRNVIGLRKRGGAPGRSILAACDASMLAADSAQGDLIRGVVDYAAIMTSDSLFTPASDPILYSMFGPLATVTIGKAVSRLKKHGLISSEKDSRTDHEIWLSLPPEERTMFRNSFCTPGSEGAEGFVGGEGAASIIVGQERISFRDGHWPKSIFYGTHVAGAEANLGNFAGMDYQSLMEAYRVGIELAEANFSPEEIGKGIITAINGHLTSTRTSNAAWATAVLGSKLKGDKLRVEANMGFWGHLQGAAGLSNIVLDMELDRLGAEPQIMNFRERDSRIAKVDPNNRLLFQTTHDYLGDAIKIFDTQAFGGSSAMAVVGRFPQDRWGAKEAWRELGYYDHEIADWIAVAQDNKARAEEIREAYLKGELSHLDIATQFGFEDFSKVDANQSQGAVPVSFSKTLSLTKPDFSIEAGKHSLHYQVTLAPKSIDLLHISSAAIDIFSRQSFPVPIEDIRLEIHLDESHSNFQSQGFLDAYRTDFSIEFRAGSCVIGSFHIKTPQVMIDSKSGTIQKDHFPERNRKIIASLPFSLENSSPHLQPPFVLAQLESFALKVSNEVWNKKRKIKRLIYEAGKAPTLEEKAVLNAIEVKSSDDHLIILTTNKDGEFLAETRIFFEKEK